MVQFLFAFPYCRIEQLATHMKITRQTASSWLHEITKAGFLEETQVGRHKIYINRALIQLFA
ncbi:MAG: helix-turn-helix domain-containing protein [Micrococcaceae bacterium]